MGEKLKNIVCEPSDILGDIKIEIIELISLNRLICNNLPNLQIPSTVPSLPSINPSQAVIEFLKDILAVIRGINYEEMRMQLIDWLVEKVRPLERDLNLNLKRWLKACYACKTTTTIPNWIFKTDPTTIQYDINGNVTYAGDPGQGINIPLNKIDLSCLFSVNPSSAAGKLLYDGSINDDMNTFLWQVIQDNNQTPNAPRPWKDPITNKIVAWFTYLEDDNNAFISQTNTGQAQDADPTEMVFKMFIDDSYHDKNIINFINDYMNSQTPLFDADKLIPNTIDYIFGTITNKIELPEECVGKIVELETSIVDYINVGIENPDIVMDDSFYTFSPEQLDEIKQKVKNKQLGTLQFQKCCQKKRSKIGFKNLEKFNEDIKNTSQLNEKINVYKGSIGVMADEMSSFVPANEKGFALNEFFSDLITGLQVALTKMILQPKLLMLFQTMNFLVSGKIVNDNSVKGILKGFECLIREILGELIRKLIYEFLLPLIINALKDIIICAITKKLKEKQIYDLLSRASLLPGFVSGKLESINKLLGKGSQVVDAAQGFADKINLNAMNNINLRNTKGGKFCD